MQCCRGIDRNETLSAVADSVQFDVASTGTAVDAHVVPEVDVNESFT